MKPDEFGSEVESMSGHDLARQPDESLAAYIDRLTTLAREELSPAELLNLNLSLRAAEALRRRQAEAKAPAPPQPESGPPSADDPDTDSGALRRCKTAYRELSGEERALFLHWQKTGMSD